MSEPLAEPLLVELRSTLERADPIPDGVLATARASFTWRNVDAELAELVADSLLTGTGVRAAGGARLLTFEGPGVEVEVQVIETGRTRRLTGQLIPVGPATISVRWSGGDTADDLSTILVAADDLSTILVVADDLGRFTADSVPAGSISLSIVRPGFTHPVVTSWISV